MKRRDGASTTAVVDVGHNRESMKLVCFALCVGCGGSVALAPNTVASPWVAQSLEKDPDVVMAVDVRAVRADPFFGKALGAVMDDMPLPYDAFLGAREIDLFGVARGLTGSKSVFTAAVFGGGDLSGVERCLTRDAYDDITVSSRAGVWIVSNGKSPPVTPSAVTMDGGAIMETWVGPGAVDLARAKRGALDMWQHLHAMRIRVLGGDTPGMVIDARFETPVDAEHAEYDLARAERMLQRAIGDGDKEAAPLVLEQLPNVHVSRSGVDLQVSYRMTPALTAYVSRAIDESRRHHDTRRGCDPDK